MGKNIEFPIHRGGGDRLEPPIAVPCQDFAREGRDEAPGDRVLSNDSDMGSFILGTALLRRDLVSIAIKQIGERGRIRLDPGDEDPPVHFVLDLPMPMHRHRHEYRTLRIAVDIILSAGF